MPGTIPEWLVISFIWIFVSWLILEHIPNGKLQNTLSLGNFFAWSVRLFVLYHHSTNWDTLSRYAFVIAVVSAIITWFCVQIRKPSRIPLTARMQRERERREP